MDELCYVSLCLSVSEDLPLLIHTTQANPAAPPKPPVPTHLGVKHSEARGLAALSDGRSETLMKVFVRSAGGQTTTEMSSLSEARPEETDGPLAVEN